MCVFVFRTVLFAWQTGNFTSVFVQLQHQLEAGSMNYSPVMHSNGSIWMKVFLIRWQVRQTCFCTCEKTLVITNYISVIETNTYNLNNQNKTKHPPLCPGDGRIKAWVNLSQFKYHLSGCTCRGANKAWLTRSATPVRWHMKPYQPPPSIRLADKKVWQIIEHFILILVQVSEGTFLHFIAPEDWTNNLV